MSRPSTRSAIALIAVIASGLGASLTAAPAALASPSATDAVGPRNHVLIVDQSDVQD